MTKDSDERVNRVTLAELLSTRRDQLFFSSQRGCRYATNGRVPTR
jgi:hypothetical protein